MMHASNQNSKNNYLGVERNAWEKYRPKTAINFSDVIEDRTIYEHPSNISSPLTPSQSKSSFEPTEITGRSTTCMPSQKSSNMQLDGESDADVDAMSVEKILCESFVDEVRYMSQKHEALNGKSICLSLPSRCTTANSMASKDLSWNAIKMGGGDTKNAQDSLASVNFQPAEKVQDALLKDEKEWEFEYADLPPVEAEKPYKSISQMLPSEIKKKISGKLVNLDDFSGYLGETNSLTESSNISMGNFFSNRCEDIREMIPTKSPVKFKPIALLSDSYRSGTDYNTSADSRKYSQDRSSRPNENISSSVYTDDDLKIKSLPRINNATYEKQVSGAAAQSVLSVSSIAAQLSDESHPNDTPKTFLNKLYAQRSISMKSLASKSDEMAKEPLPTRILGQNSQNASNKAETNMTNSSKKSIGMLARINSTQIEEKENEWRPNASADTESIDASILNLTDYSTSSYDSSMKDISSPETYATRKNPNNPDCLGIPHDQQVSKNKRMRSPNHGKISRSPSPENMPDLNGLHLYSPKRPASQLPILERNEHRNNGRGGWNHQDRETRSEEPRQFIVPNQSPINGSKFSLPNYGLRGACRSLAHSPNGAVAVARSSSQCSTNSEYTQNDGKFPLKANKSELTWECTKLRKSVTKSIVVKNSAHKKLSLKIEVIGPGFQIFSTGQDKESLVLQGNECRTISVTFCPTVIGKALGKVIFKPTKNWPEEIERTVYLYGYGGNTTLQLQGIERGPVGISFLKMAETANIRSTTLKRSFSIYNKGPLNGIATIFVKPKTNQYIHETHISIEPNKCVILPDSFVNISVTYKLRRKDLEKLSQKSCEVLTVATLEVIIGSEPNRQRIASMLTRTDTIPSMYKPLDFLVRDFPVCSSERFDDFNESLSNVSDLFNCFKTSEIALTINRTTLDDTRDTCSDLSGIEESFFFRTLIDDPKPSQENRQTNKGEIETKSISKELWSVQPKRLIMDFMENAQKSIIIQSHFHKEQTFQLDSNCRHIFNFSSTSGRIRAGAEYKIDVELKKNSYIPSGVKITIYIESDCIEIPVNIQQAPLKYMQLN